VKIIEKPLPEVLSYTHQKMNSFQYRILRD